MIGVQFILSPIKSLLNAFYLMLHTLHKEGKVLFRIDVHQVLQNILIARGFR